MRAVGANATPVAAVTNSSVRFFLRQMLEGTLPNLCIFSHNEIPNGVRVISLGLIQ